MSLLAAGLIHGAKPKHGKLKTFLGLYCRIFRNVFKATGFYLQVKSTLKYGTNAILVRARIKIQIDCTKVEIGR